MRRLLLVGMIALGVLFLQPFTQPAPQASGATVCNQPILFVHGYLEGGLGLWNTMIARLKADGCPSSKLFDWNYNSALSNATIASQIKTKVNQIKAATGASKVDIVSHSMGGLSSRYYLKNLGGTANVDQWISLAGPNHGTNISYLCLILTPISCLEMLPGSFFVRNLNSGDETPGSVRYATWWSPCDEIILPPSSTILSGATNTMNACVLHIAETQDWNVYTQVRAFLSQ
jgi:triacylglycerol lipase